MRKKIILILFIFLFTPALFCGDLAKFVNMGFSDNNKYYMFAQYGIKQENSGSYAELYIVDIKKNDFTQHGTKSLSYNIPPEPGTDGMGALFNIIEQNIALKVKYKINHLKTGRILYFYMHGDDIKSKLKFRDFVTKINYDVQLIQKSFGTKKNISASFHIKLTTQSAGKTKNYQIGLPNYKRKGVKNYKITQIILGPDEKSVIMVIEKEELNNLGSNFRYMIETFQMK